MNATHSIHRYLQLLAGDEQPDRLLELRWRLGTSQILRREFFRVDDRGAMAAAILSPPWDPRRHDGETAEQHAQRKPTDVYVGCAPRRPSSGGGRAAVDRVWTLWVETDNAAAAEALRAFPLRPSALIRSGTGNNAHAYFALSEPVSADVAEVANRRLAAALGGDPVCFDAARILRPPATRNHKTRPARAVVAEWIEPARRRPLTAWLEHAPELQAQPTPSRAPAPSVRRSPGRGGADQLTTIDPETYVLTLLRLDELPRDRKVSCPLHEDRRPSLHVYPTAARGWFCFSCRRGGSIFDLAAALWGYRTSGPEFLLLREELTALFAPLARTEACA